MRIDIYRLISDKYALYDAYLSAGEITRFDTVSVYINEAKNYRSFRYQIPEGGELEIQIFDKPSSIPGSIQVAIPLILRAKLDEYTTELFKILDLNS